MIAAPLFIISHPPMVIAQAKAGIVGAFPALNARPAASNSTNGSARSRKRSPPTTATIPNARAAPFAVNQIVHKSNTRLEHDLEACVKHKVPIVITSLGARPEVNEAVHSYGGIVLHDIINDRFAHKAIEKGADGLIAVAAGAGGHAGTLSPFALIQEIRQWFDGPLYLSGGDRHRPGGAAQPRRWAPMAATSARPSSPPRRREPPRTTRTASLPAGADDIVYTNLFTGIHGNYLRASIEQAGLDPDHLPVSDPNAMDFSSGASKPKAWKEIWGSGQGIGAVKSVEPVSALVDRLVSEYEAARKLLAI